MSIGFYQPGNSLIHRLPPSAKLIALVALCASVFVFDNVAFNGAITLLVLAGYSVARIPLRTMWQQIRPVALFLGIIFIAELVFIDAQTATLVVIRFFAMILAASLVTLTTRSSEMLSALESGLKPFSLIGVNTAKASLALSLAIRFIPMIAVVTHEVREAQRVRGLDRSILAVAVPTIVRTLKMADEIADAIDARCYGGRA